MSSKSQTIANTHKQHPDMFRLLNYRCNFSLTKCCYDSIMWILYKRTNIILPTYSNVFLHEYVSQSNSYQWHLIPKFTIPCKKCWIDCTATEENGRWFPEAIRRQKKLSLPFPHVLHDKKWETRQGGRYSPEMMLKTCYLSHSTDQTKLQVHSFWPLV